MRVWKDSCPSRPFGEENSIYILYEEGLLTFGEFRTCRIVYQVATFAFSGFGVIFTPFSFFD